MSHKKNEFWNLCFSVIPGAGQMYQGFLKRGVSIMILFFGWLALCDFVGIDEGIFFAPVVWFFAFFDSLHRNALTDAERELLKDEFIFINGKELKNFSLREFRIPVAVLLLFLGSYSILEIIIDQLVDAGFLSWRDGIFQLFYYRIPKMVFSFAIIFLGIYLIRGKKKEIMGREEKKEEEKFPWMTQYHEEAGQGQSEEKDTKEAFDEEQKEDGGAQV